MRNRQTVSWDLEEVQENPRTAMAWNDEDDLRVNDTVMPLVYPTWETAWLGWYEVEQLPSGIFKAVCTADLARWEGQPQCRDPRWSVTHPREARVRDLVEKHILRRCGESTIPKYVAPRNCPF